MKHAKYIAICLLLGIGTAFAGGHPNQHDVDHDRTRVSRDQSRRPDPEPSEAAGQARDLAKDQARLAHDLTGCPTCH